MWKYLILIVLLCHFQKDQAQDESPDSGRELTYLQILTTNAFYAPLSLYAQDENTADDWPEGLGLLPKLGKLQQYELGKFLRKRYDHFITTDPGEVDAFSSFEDRSTVSLLSLLASLYAPTEEWQFMPGFKWQPIVISYMEEDDIFFNYQDVCEKYWDDLSKHMNSDPVKEILEQDAFLYEYLRENSGNVVDDWIDVARLYDTIEKEQKAGLKVPRWARMYLQDMKRITDFAYTWHYNTTTSLQLKVGSLIDLLTVRMRVKALPQDPSPLIKVSIYVTHDWNLAALLSVMRLSNGLRPPPCATISFEMYREGKEHTIRTLFFNSTHPETGVDQEPHLLILEGCTEYCPLSTFVQFFHDVIPEDYNEVCGENVESLETTDEAEGKEQSPIYPMYYKMKEITRVAQL
ncbi:testicular acid phosphatase homolog [Nephila pilipes]|uniref:acid phosphatase n=1 Tax=Nephila pilipes TaxID=299642 RepID=A0A8X6QII8_NEPPI|nr:testicular acid phosphatase homolog [Nephila pilipes]